MDWNQSSPESNDFSPEDENYYQRERDKIIREKNVRRAKERFEKEKQKMERRRKRHQFFHQLSSASLNLIRRWVDPTSLVAILLDLLRVLVQEGFLHS